MLLCKNDAKEDPIKITHITNKQEINNISDISAFYQRQIKSFDLPCNKKWTPIILSLFSEQKTPYNFCNLSLYGIVKRGIASGANDFFALTKATIEQHKFNELNICKCVTKSSQIRTLIFNNDDFNKLYHANKPVYCLDVKDHENQEIQKYIAKGKKLGYHERYLTKTHNIWYSIECRTPAPILFGVFNRGRFKVIRNFTTEMSNNLIDKVIKSPL